VIQAFYNIHISHALARARGLPYQLKEPTEFTSRYTRYCIGEFIRTYPNVGLMMTLGEALAPEYGPEWLAKTIIPGVKDGMRELGTAQEPPIIVRAHATRIEDAMRQALPLYKNIYHAQVERRVADVDGRARRGAAHASIAGRARFNAHRQHSFAVEPGAVPLGRAKLHPEDPAIVPENRHLAGVYCEGPKQGYK
jgi:hypothetical protein